VAGRINREDIDRLRQQADALAVIGDHTNLKRSGKSWKGLCPFHTEKTPSFHVMPGEARWYCYGCSEGGDLIDFLQRIDGLDFVEAVESLARRTGVTLRYEELSARQRKALGEQARMLEVNQAAMAWFTAQLLDERGTVARQYLKDRGFGKQDAERFHLGFAPDEWDGLSRHLTEQEGFDRQDVFAVRLAKPNSRGGMMDTFRGRLVFPVLDVRGDPIGFGGRVLPALDYGDYTPPKYLNSPEYRLYQKTKVLYGMYEARTAIAAAQEVVICEGYTDVMALHQAGFGNAVATCGTAVGPEHFRLLAPRVERIVLAFDADEAGHKAARRAFEAAREVHDAGAPEFQLRVLVLPDGTDPADMVRDAGVQAVREAVAEAPDVVPFLVRGIVTGIDPSDEEARVEALHETVELLGLEPDPDRRRVWARTEVAEGLGLSLEFVARTADRQGVQLDRHDGVARSVATTERGRVVPADVTRARVARERTVLRFAMQSPEDLPEEWYELAADDFSHPSARSVFETMGEAGGAGMSLTAMLEATDDGDVERLLQELAVEEPAVPDSRAAVAEQVRHVLAERLDEHHQARSRELAAINETTDGDRVVELLRELQELEARRRRLRRGGAHVGAGQGVGDG